MKNSVPYSYVDFLIWPSARLSLSAQYALLYAYIPLYTRSSYSIYLFLLFYMSLFTFDLFLNIQLYSIRIDKTLKGI